MMKAVMGAALALGLFAPSARAGSSSAAVVDTRADVLAEILPATCSYALDGEGLLTVKFTADASGVQYVLPDNLGPIAFDVNGRTVTGKAGTNGTSATAGGDGSPVFQVGSSTTVTVLDSAGSTGRITGGKGGEGNPAGKGAFAFADSTGAEVAVTDPLGLVAKGADGVFLKSKAQEDLENIFDVEHTPTMVKPEYDASGVLAGHKVILGQDYGPVALSNDFGAVTIDLNGWTIRGADGATGTATTAGGNGGAAITVAGTSGAAAGTTAITVTEGSASLGGVQLWENGPFFAECNLGASSPEEFGCYFWWGDTVGYTNTIGDTNGTGTWLSVADGTTSIQFNGSDEKAGQTYNEDNATLKALGYIDDETNPFLNAAHDAATVHLGAPWRLVTKAELDKLGSSAYCQRTWVDSYNGKSVAGFVVRGKAGTAYENNEIFIPASGNATGSSINYSGEGARCWTAEPHSNITEAKNLYLGKPNSLYASSYNRYAGTAVRPVRGFAKPCHVIGGDGGDGNPAGKGAFAVADATGAEVSVSDPLALVTKGADGDLLISLPTGVQGYSYVVSNLTADAEGEIAPSGSEPGGATYALPVGAHVAIYCVPSAGYTVQGTNPYDIPSVTDGLTIDPTALPKGAVAASVTVSRIQQRYPWNGKVDIDYTVAGVADPDDCYLRFTVFTNADDSASGFVARAFDDDSRLARASNGTYRATWDSLAEVKFFLATNASIKADLVYDPGNAGDRSPYATEFMVIDLVNSTATTDYSVSYETFYGEKAMERTKTVYNTDEYKTNKIVLRRIRRGIFTAGSPTTETGRIPASWAMGETQHETTLTKDFYIGVFELTQGQYEKVMAGANPSYWTSDTMPVEQVTYQTIRGTSLGMAVPIDGRVDESSFMGQLRKKTGLDDFDLPTEHQFEYASRAGTTESTYFGNNVDQATLDTYTWNVNNSSSPSMPQVVGGKDPNPWGLYDMLGNCWEWSRDRVATAGRGGNDYTTAVVDPLLQASGGTVAVRGSCAAGDATELRSACRAGLSSTTVSRHYGFRLYCAADEVLGGDAVDSVTVSKLCLDTRRDAVKTVRSFSEVFAFAWNDSDVWAKGGDGSGARVALVPMSGGGADPSAWTVAGSEQTLVDSTGEGVEDWANPHAGRYRMTLSAATGTERETAYFDLTNLKVWDELETIFDTAHTATTVEPVYDASGNLAGHKVILGQNYDGGVALSNDFGAVTIDLNGWTISGTNGTDGSTTTAGTAGGAAITVAGTCGADEGATAITVTNTAAAGSAAAIVGGKGGEGNPAGKGAFAFADSTGAEVAVTDPLGLVAKGADGVFLKSKAQEDLEKIFDVEHTPTMVKPEYDASGVLAGHKVILGQDYGPVALSNDFGAVTIDLNGWTIRGADGATGTATTAGGGGGSAIVVDGECGAAAGATAITVKDDSCVQLWENGPYFSVRNVGAKKPQEYGYYFWWGDTVGYVRNSSNNGWDAVDGSTTGFSFITDNCPTYGKNIAELYADGNGYIDANSTDGKLKPEHDAATVHWGAPWRMPTKAELDDLKSKCALAWTVNWEGTGLNGFVVTGNTTGYTDKRIFLPAAGGISGTSSANPGPCGNCWSSTPSWKTTAAWLIYFDKNGTSAYEDGSRQLGFSVRAVRGSEEVRPVSGPSAALIGGNGGDGNPAGKGAYAFVKKSDGTEFAVTDPNGLVAKGADGDVLIALPAGVAGQTYVVSNLTADAEGEIAPSGSEPGGATYALPVGAHVAIYCVPAAGYTVQGTNPYDIPTVTLGVTIDPADLPKGAHHLAVTKAGGDAEKDVDYRWNGKLLVVLNDGLTISGTTAVERVQVDASGVTFDGVNIRIGEGGSSGYNIVYVGSSDCTLTLVGENELGGVGNYAISSYNNLTVDGTGSLNIGNGVNGGIWTDGDLTISGSVDVTVTPAEYNSIWSQGGITVEGAVNLTVTNSFPYTCVGAGYDIGISTSGRVELWNTGGCPAIGSSNGDVSLAGTGEIVGFSEECFVETFVGSVYIGTSDADTVSVVASNLSYSCMWAVSNLYIRTGGRVACTSGSSVLGCEGTMVFGPNATNVVLRGGEPGETGALELYGQDALVLPEGWGMMGSTDVNAEVLPHVASLRYVEDGTWEAHTGMICDDFAKVVTFGVATLTPVTLPTGVGHCVYVVSNLTDGTTIESFGTTAGLPTYELPIGAHVAVYCVPDDGYAALGANPYDVAAVAQWETIPAEDLPEVVQCYLVSYDANGAAGEMATDTFVPTIPTNLTANAFTIVGYGFKGWTNGVTDVFYTNRHEGVNFAAPGETLELTALWDDTGVTVSTFGALTNALVTATNQTAALPVTVKVSGRLAIPAGGVVKVYDSPAVTFEFPNVAEDWFDATGIVPAWGEPVVIGEGFPESILTPIPRFRSPLGEAKVTYEPEGGKVVLHARGESADFPWLVGDETGVTAWADPALTNLAAVVIDNGLPTETINIDLVSLTNNLAKYGYEPAVAALNALVKTGMERTDEWSEESPVYKMPTRWISADGTTTYETLAEALAAGATAVVPEFAENEPPKAIVETFEVVDPANPDATIVVTATVVNENEDGVEANAFQAVEVDAAMLKEVIDEMGFETFWDMDDDNDVAYTNLVLTVSAKDEAGAAAVDETDVDSLTNATTGVASAFEMPRRFVSLSFADVTLKFVDENGIELERLRELCDDYDNVHPIEITVPFAFADPKDVFVARHHVDDGGDLYEVIPYTNLTDVAEEDLLRGQEYFTADVEKQRLTLHVRKFSVYMIALAEPDMFQVTFDAMGPYFADGSELVTTNCYVRDGYALPESDPERADYTFIGWFDGVTNNAAAVTNAQPLLRYAEHTLYAKWKSTQFEPSGTEVIKTDGAGVIVTQDVKTTDALVLPEMNLGGSNGVALVGIGEKAFLKNTGLTSVALPLFVKDIGKYAFANATGIREIRFVQPRDATTGEKTTLAIGDGAFSGLSLTNLVIPAYVASIGEKAFAGNTTLSNVTIMGTTQINWAKRPFLNCGAKAPGGKVTLHLSYEVATNKAYATALWNYVTNYADNVQIDFDVYGKVTGVVSGADFVKFTAEIATPWPVVSAQSVKILATTGDLDETPLLENEWTTIEPDSVEPVDGQPNTYLATFGAQAEGTFYRVSIVMPEEN